jgi:hypothetical protein
MPPHFGSVTAPQLALSSVHVDGTQGGGPLSGLIVVIPVSGLVVASCVPVSEPPSCVGFEGPELLLPHAVKMSAPPINAAPTVNRALPVR